MKPQRAIMMRSLSKRASFLLVARGGENVVDDLLTRQLSLLKSVSDPAWRTRPASTGPYAAQELLS
jgi:hypothetical protein